MVQMIQDTPRDGGDEDCDGLTVPSMAAAGKPMPDGESAW